METKLPPIRIIGTKKLQSVKEVFFKLLNIEIGLEKLNRLWSLDQELQGWRLIISNKSENEEDSQILSYKLISRVDRPPTSMEAFTAVISDADWGYCFVVEGEMNQASSKIDEFPLNVEIMNIFYLLSYLSSVVEKIENCTCMRMQILFNHRYTGNMVLRFINNHQYRPFLTLNFDRQSPKVTCTVGGKNKISSEFEQIGNDPYQILTHVLDLLTTYNSEVQNA